MIRLRNPRRVVTHLVFAQSSGLDLPTLDAQARRLFEAAFEALAATGPDLRFRLEAPTHLRGASFRLHPRPRSEADLERAKRAETRGRAAGMAALAARCAAVWEVHADPDAPAEALHTVCAVLASVALGPVLPPDDSTLYGVRGALARATAARAAPS